MRQLELSTVSLARLDCAFTGAVGQGVKTTVLANQPWLHLTGDELSDRDFRHLGSRIAGPFCWSLRVQGLPAPMANSVENGCRGGEGSLDAGGNGTDPIQLVPRAWRFVAETSGASGAIGPASACSPLATRATVLVNMKLMDALASADLEPLGQGVCSGKSGSCCFIS